MNNKKRTVVCIIFSILCFLLSFLFILLRFNNSFTLSVLNIVNKFRPDVGIEKISKLYSFIECNIVFFIFYGFSFITLIWLYHDGNSEYNLKIFTSPKLIKINSYSVAIIIVFIFSSILRFYWINQKISFHMDELYGISIFHYNKYGLWSGQNFEKDIAFTGKQIKDLILFDDGSIKDTIKDCIHLWIYNRDTAYNNLFLVLSRIWYTGFETSNFKLIFWRAGILNYIFYCFSFYFFLKLLNTVSENNVLKLLSLGIAFINPATIGLTVFMRSYALQECLFILFTYIFIYYFSNIHNKVNVNTKRNFIITTIVLFLVINCDYYSILYVCILGLILIIQALIYKQYSVLYSLICSVLLALIFSKIFYLNFGIGFFTDRGSEALDTFSNNNTFLSTFIELKNAISSNLISFFAISIFNTILFVIFIIKQKKLGSITFILFIIALVWSYFVFFISPYNILRYIAAIFPIFAVTFSKPLFENNKIYLYLNYCLIGLFFIFTIYNVLPLSNNNSKIEHLNDTDGRVFSQEFMKEDNAVLYIDRNSLYTELLPYLKDSHTIYFIDSYQELNELSIPFSEYYYVKYDDPAPHTFTVIKCFKDK